MKKVIVRLGNGLGNQLFTYAAAYSFAKKNNAKIMIFGNGGSAAIASHVSVDLTKNANVRCVNYNEADLITCFSNDYGYERWVEKAIDFYADSKDTIILISSSGKSKNMINACKTAKKRKIIVFYIFLYLLF